jgi:hypothetical protein
MRIVGTQNRSEIETDAARMLVRALAWRGTDNVGSLAHPKGVLRGTHSYFNALDAARSLEQARLLNAPQSLMRRTA